MYSFIMGQTKGALSADFVRFLLLLFFFFFFFLFLLDLAVGALPPPPPVEYWRQKEKKKKSIGDKNNLKSIGDKNNLKSIGDKNKETRRKKKLASLIASHVLANLLIASHVKLASLLEIFFL